MENLKHDIKTVLITREQIAKRVREMGQQITKDYAGKEIVLVGILKGAMPFLCDLMREIDLPVILDTMVVPAMEMQPHLPAWSRSRKIWTAISADAMSSL